MSNLGNREGHQMATPDPFAQPRRDQPPPTWPAEFAPPTKKRRSPWFYVLIAFLALVVVVMAAGVVAFFVWWFFTPGWGGTDETTARADAEILGRAVAEHVATDGELPRVSVAPDGPVNETWADPGDSFLVESREVLRADPDGYPWFFVVGTADEWCVEVSYDVPSEDSGFITDAFEVGWVHVMGAGDSAGAVSAGRCGRDHVIVLEPASSVTDGPAAGEVVDAATVPVGTCTSPLRSQEGLFLDAPEDIVTTEPVTVVDCADLHAAEFFYTGELTNSDGRYDDIWEEPFERCISEFTSFVGVHYDLSVFEVEPFWVTEEQWQAGERSFTCALYLGGDDYPLVGTAKDGRR